MKTEMNLYFIESIHLKTLKGKKNGTNVPVQLQQPKKKKNKTKQKSQWEIWEWEVEKMHYY